MATLAQHAEIQAPSFSSTFRSAIARLNGGKCAKKCVLAFRTHTSSRIEIVGIDAA